MAAASVKEKSTLQLNPTTFSDNCFQWFSHILVQCIMLRCILAHGHGCKKLVKSGQYIPDFGMGVKTWCEELALAANPCQTCQD